MKKILLIMLLLICINVKASIVVMDADSGRVLYSKDKNDRMLIASTTKIMTAIVALENAKLSDTYVVGDEIDKVNGSMIYSKKGDKFTLNDLLHGLLLRSGNDAAMTIASNVMKYDDFIKEMNQKAFVLGMYNTTFENPHGLNDYTKNYSTAYDLAILMKYAIKNDDFLKISQTLKYKTKNYIWYNKNELLANYKYAISGKIGFTKKSGPVFVSSARKNNKTLVIATINEPDKFNLHKSLYENFFKKYNRYKVLDSNKISSKLRQKNNTHYYIKNDYFMLLQKNEFKKVDVIFYKNRQNAYINVYYDSDLIHTEKVYKLDYKKRVNKIKDILFFWK